MDAALFFKALWTYKWLMIFGVLVALAAALFAGFKVETGSLDYRAETQYNAATTVLLSNAQTSVFQAEVPGQVIDPNVTAPQARDLSSTAVIYAYLISGNVIRDLVEQQVGPLSDAESITAVQRTTQPAGSEANPGRLNLPIIDVRGSALSPERAEEISSAATSAFLDFAVNEQNTAGIPPAERVQMTPLITAKAEAVDSSNPLIPIVAVGAGVLFAFTALSLILFNVRMRRTERAVAAAETGPVETTVPETWVTMPRVTESRLS
ncbi:hypothetical protein ACFSBZ_14235 [Amnibacterium flavum]|uniref:Capsular polysaccharide biosynthesis protein n=1 Tax=Amnibacterium flavum TaxID=2173173 RepID=A0A2V1HXB8_9MICO|nr:hypothetical protein [Amnibacterium flavum]PVZ95910.1 hypothetical protein DDQ50_05440 [Amnibacterium flavum]